MPLILEPTATDSSFDTGILNQGESGSVEVTQAGDIEFFCGVHPGMKGKLTVKAGNAGTTETGSDSAY